MDQGLLQSLLRAVSDCVDKKLDHFTQTVSKPSSRAERQTEQAKKRFDKGSSNRGNPDSNSRSDFESVHGGPVLSIGDSSESLAAVSNADNSSDVLSNSQNTHIRETDWDSFVRKMALVLNIDCGECQKGEEHKSYITGRLLDTSHTKSARFLLPLEGSVLDALHDVDAEVGKRKVRIYKAADDSRYKVSTDHFKKFCCIPHLDENIAEELSSQSATKSGLTPHGQGKRVKLQN
ncbi:hypothetical protein LOTGIDRAFT_157537 [Lottia gigantea]|uniref:Uncharacterized protein n=1 Tax=Lottia gigantea TaxID=225164 RepID=V4B1W5_LOTGI|nr:hypothetical protein LOTGIDRAFT_157537 [Lottia gigantea]ESP01361.1 hypothetical protein LOTGIDRAFT_157537 [Lottia gigantea]